MKNLILALLSENSKISSLRLMSLTSLFSAVGMAVYGLYMNRDIGTLAILVGVFVSAAFGGKISQKFIEKKE
jgi:hypothetical protein